MRRTLLLVAAMVTAWPVAGAETQGPPAKPDLARAQSIVKDVCSACHGLDGNSTTPVNPSLAGMPAEYITLQLTHFKAGIRVNPVMQGMAATLTPEEMKALGIYFAHQNPKGLAAKDASVLTAGQSLYRGGDAGTGVPACAACHGPDGSGVPKNYPRLGGQYAEYTYAQLKAFKQGERGADKEGKDVNGRIMAAITSRMTDAQMKAVAEYTSGLR